MILLVVFALYTSVLLLNFLIAFMSEVVSEKKILGKRARLKQMAEVIFKLPDILSFMH